MVRPTLGEMMYSEYVRLQGERGVDVDSWTAMSPDDHEIWEAFAEAIDFEPHDGICDRFTDMGRPYRS